jgi:hypothetical protein
MKKSLKYLFPGALLLLVVLACNFSGDTAENSNSGLNLDSGDSGNVDSGDVPTGTSLTITNNSERTVCGMYIALQEATDWGEEQLGTEVVDPGESHAIEASDGTFSVRANDCDGNLIAEDIEFEIDGPTTWEVEEKAVDNVLVPSGEAGTLTVVNNSSDDVCYVFVSPTGSTTWGSDWLGEDTVLGEGDEQTITVGAAVYDLQAADCDGNAVAEQYEVDFSTGQTWTLD